MPRHRSLPIVLSLLLALVAGLLAACGAAPAAPAAPAPVTVRETVVVEQQVVVTATPAPAAAPAAKPSGKIVVWVQQSGSELYEKTAMEGFRQEYPGIEVEFVNNHPNDITKNLALAFSAGTGAPDVAITGTGQIPRLIELGGLADLSAQIGPIAESLSPSMLSQLTKDGQIYGMPLDVGPVVLFYRRDVFKAAGLPDAPEEVTKLVATWDEFLGVCETILEQTGSPCFAQNKANNYGDLLEIMLWQQGQGYYDDAGKLTVDSPETVATLEKLGEFWEAGVVSDNLEWTDGWYADLSSPLGGDVKPIATMPIAAWLGNSLKTWIAPGTAGNWGVAELPAMAPGGARAANLGGSAAVIPAQSENQAAALAFIQYVVGSEESQVKQLVVGDIFPALTSSYDSPAFLESDAFYGGQAARQVFAKAAANTPSANIYGPNFFFMHETVATAVQKYATGQASAADALSEAAELIRAETGME
jgi:lactose/L-arabinose transport system substrate-binding protein